MSKLWVKFGQNNAVKVSTDGCVDIDDFIKAVKKELTYKLAEYDSDQISVSLTEGGQPLRPGMRLNELYTDPAYIENTDGLPLYISAYSSNLGCRKLILGLVNCWLVTGKVSGALAARGVRSILYRMAHSLLGYYDGEQPAFDYFQKTLNFHVIFETKTAALQFKNRLEAEGYIFGSPLAGLQIDTSVEETTRNELGKLISLNDYKPDESGSPSGTMSQSIEFSTYGSTTDLFKYQRIESLSVFTSKGKAESAHLMSKAHCKAFESYLKFENDENNRLALSRDFHGFLDELNTELPLVNIEFKNVSKNPVVENRYEVTILVKALDQESANALFWRLKEGSKKTDDDLIMEASVYVLNPAIFKKCLDWKCKQIKKRWDDYFNMDSAVS
jgi:hypothetical protein